MAVITLRNMEPALLQALKREAEQENASLNKTAQRLLAKALGLSARKRVFTDLDHLAGTWSTEEADEFDEALKEQRQIDPELWK